MSSSKNWAVIAGVGPGTGAAIARKFAQAYSVALLARKPESYEPLVKEIEATGSKAVGISTDLSDAKSVQAAFEKIQKEVDQQGGQVFAAVYNAAPRFVRKPFLELTQEDFEAGFELGGRGAFLFSKAALPSLLKAAKSPDPPYPPSLIFTSATAALRGSALLASYASGKFALRAMAQSLAREFGPEGIHVSHAIIDGVIDTERTKQWLRDAPADAKIKPEDIADAYWYLHTQPKTCFTFEIDIRPYVEKW